MKNCPAGDKQLWDLIRCNAPDNLLIDAEIVVDEDIAHSNDSAPRNVGLNVSQFVWKYPNRFANNLNVPNRRIEDALISQKLFKSS
jgi:hypothetical protein